MKDKETGFSLEMPRVGIIKGVLAKDIEVVGDKVVNLRTCARPYRNLYSVAQLRTIKNVIEKYGSGKVHLSPRHNLEIPEVRQKELDKALKELYISGLFPGGAGTSVRNIFTCPDWCTKSIRPVQEIGKMVSMNFGDRDMPNKVTISFAGCSNSCSRPQNSDIGVIAIGRIKVSDKKCPDDCSDCIKACKFQAIEETNGSVKINDKCIYCCKCVEACYDGVLKIKETGFKMLIGGKEGSTVMFGKEYATFVEDFEVLEIIEKALSHYQKKAKLRPGSEKKKERLGDVVNRLGIDSFMGISEKSDINKRLRLMACLSGLKDDDLNTIGGQAEIKKFSKNEIIFAESEPIKFFFIIESGSVKLYKSSDEGRELLVSIFKSGDYFCLPLHNIEKKYLVSARAIEDSTLIVIPSKDFKKLLRSAANETGLKIIEGLCDKIKTLSGLLEDVAFKDVEHRVIKTLLKLVEGEPSKDNLIHLAVSHHDIATMTGTVREVVSRTMLKLKKEGVICDTSHKGFKIDKLRLLKFV